MASPMMFPEPPNIFSSWYPIGIAVIAGVLYALRQWFRGPQYIGTSKLKGKTVIVTGANSGIGLAVATDLATRGARVFLVCRDEQKGKEAEEEIRKTTENMNVIFMKCDLGSFKSIREFVENFKKKEEKLDILINNAGVMMCPEDETKDKFERQFGVNYLGTFLLTELLLDLLKASGSARIVNTSASASNLGKIHFDDINMKEDYSPGQAYAQSKLAVDLYTIKLAERLKNTKVTVVSVNPGIVNSPGLRHLPMKTSSFLRLSLGLPVWFMLKTPKDGANTTIYAAVDEKLEGVTGKRYKDCQEVKFEENTKDEKIIDKLYEETLEWTGLKKKLSEIN